MANRAKTVAADGDLAMMTFAGFSDSRAEEEASPPKKRSPGKKEVGSRSTAAVPAIADTDEQMLNFSGFSNPTATRASPAKVTRVPRAQTLAADGNRAMMTFAGFSDSRAEEEASPLKKRSPGKKEVGSRSTAAVPAIADTDEQMIDFADADTNGSTATEASPANGDPADPAQAVAADD
ncbi:hypothetical protein OC835_007615, partial [Tilletia horrida]